MPPRNARRSAAPAASQSRKKNPTTLRISLPKKPYNKIEEVDEEDIETQSEDDQYQQISTRKRMPTRERSPTPEPEVSYG
ncbi:hypothetical protein ACJ73_03510, partial [Blastomyces percursus]